MFKPLIKALFLLIAASVVELIALPFIYQMLEPKWAGDVLLSIGVLFLIAGTILAIRNWLTDDHNEKLS